MISKLSSALHDKIHDAKIARQSRNATPDLGDDCETSSESSSEISCERESDFPSTEFAVECCIDSVVDVRASPFYMYLCIGNEGELISRKKKRGVRTSKVFHSRSPGLNPLDHSFVLPLGDFAKPELSIRVSRSAIVGPDSFLGECRFRINRKTSVDQFPSAPTCLRLSGGGNSVISFTCRVVPYTTDDRRSNIFPDESIVTESDKLQALVSSVIKCMSSIPESDSDDARIKVDWLVTLFEVIECEELEYVFIRISLVDLLRVIPSIFHQLSTKLASPYYPALFRSRIIKVIQQSSSECSADDEGVIAAVLLSCPLAQVDDLKYILNRGGDKHQLPSLMYGSIQSDLLREKLLLQFQKASTAGSTGKNVCVISEIDQVVYSPFGSVRLWPDGVIPGSRALFQGLSNDITFVSNKPISFESWTRKLIRDIGLGDAPLLTGTKSDLYALRGGMSKLQSRLEQTKYTNWSMYRRLFPGSEFVWFGQSLEFAQTLMMDEGGNGTSERNGVARVALAIVFGEERRKEIGPHYMGNGIVLCDNFIQAAIACVDSRLIWDVQKLEIMMDEFDELITKMEKDLLSRTKRYKQLIRERLSEMKRDLENLRNLVCILTQQSPVVGANLSSQEMVDSIVLTPIEPRSPAGTDESSSEIQEQIRNDVSPIAKTVPTDETQTRSTDIVD